jgi:hypothetical protein
MIATELPEAFMPDRDESGSLTEYGRDIRTAARRRYGGAIVFGPALGALIAHGIGRGKVGGALSGLFVAFAAVVVVDSLVNSFDPLTRHEGVYSDVSASPTEVDMAGAQPIIPPGVGAVTGSRDASVR